MTAFLLAEKPALGSVREIEEEFPSPRVNTPVYWEKDSWVRCFQWDIWTGQPHGKFPWLMRALRRIIIVSKSYHFTHRVKSSSSTHQSVNRLGTTASETIRRVIGVDKFNIDSNANFDRYTDDVRGVCVTRGKTQTRHQNKRSRQEAEEHPKRAEGSPPAQGSRDKKLSSSSSRQQQQQAPQKKEDKRATRQQKGKAKTGSTSAGPAAPAAPVPPPPHQQQQQQPQPPTKRQRRSGRREASAPDPPAPQQPPSEPAPLPVPPAPPAAPTAPAAAAGGSSQPPSRPSAVEMAGRPPRGMDDDDEMAGNMNSASTWAPGLTTSWAWEWLRAAGSKVRGVFVYRGVVGSSVSRRLSASADLAPRPLPHYASLSTSYLDFATVAAILSSLRQADDESAQVGALTELCEVLSISSEDTLASFPIESSVPMLVGDAYQPGQRRACTTVLRAACPLICQNNHVKRTLNRVFLLRMRKVG
eukprot:316571-Pelagomonas_calceolata.AAC.1